MNQDELDAVLNCSCEERYDYFLSVVEEERDIWILVNADQHFLKLYAEEDGFEYCPVWPSADFAKAYAQGEPGLSPKSISLPAFLKKWVPGLTRDDIEVGVMPGLDKSVWITAAEELARDLKDDGFGF